MLRIIDRQMVWNFIKSYAICLFSLLSLFIIIDLFANLDEFQQASAGKGTRHFLLNVASYYGQSAFRIFDRLCEAIALLSAVFTVAWMQRNNELLPLLSAGVSTRRVVLAVVVGAALTINLSLANQEFVLPSLDRQLIELRASSRSDKATMVKGAFDTRGIHLWGKSGLKRDQLITDFTCVIPPRVGRGNAIKLEAKEARFDAEKGGWLMTDAIPAELPNWTNKAVLEDLGRGKYFLHTDVDFDRITRTKNWHLFLSTWDLWQEMSRPGNSQIASMATIFHMRLTRPILGVVLVVLGLSIILKDQNRSIFVSAGMCLGLCAGFFLLIQTCQYLGDREFLSPAFAAWVPVLLFGPLSFVMFDAVHT